jgi:hypothetical protein
MPMGVAEDDAGVQARDAAWLQGLAQIPVRRFPSGQDLIRLFPAFLSLVPSPALACPA